MLARLGTDEFVIVVEEFATAQRQRARQTHLKQMREPFVIDENQYHLGTSIPASVSSRMTVRMDRRCYAARIPRCTSRQRLGRNNYQFFASGVNDPAQHRYALERNLRRALVEDEFLLYYQAKVNLDTQKIVSAEALIRWQMEDMNIVAPTEFIPFAEDWPDRTNRSLGFNSGRAMLKSGVNNISSISKLASTSRLNNFKIRIYRALSKMYSMRPDSIRMPYS